MTSSLRPEDPVAAVAGQLQQIAELAGSLSAEQYQHAEPAFHGSSPGQHLRHCLDHVSAFLGGLSSGEIDYDARTRDPEIERDPQAAAALSAQLAERIGSELDAFDSSMPVRVKCACDTVGEPVAQPSSLGRELQFLVSHGVHHLAMVAAQCNRMGLTPGAGMGVAPSTLRHRAADAVPGCAQPSR